SRKGRRYDRLRRRFSRRLRLGAGPWLGLGRTHHIRIGRGSAQSNPPRGPGRMPDICRSGEVFERKTMIPSLMPDLQEALAEIPILDVHTHLVGGKLGARGLHDVLLYHMVISDLYAAGCPNGSRLTQYPDWPTQKEAHGRIEEAVPFLDRIRNTSSSWGVRLILRDLYDWNEPITPDNWRRLDVM